MGASLVGAGIRVEGDDTPLPRIAVMARDRVEVVDTWNTIGLSATGSHDIRADDVVVSPDWTFVRGGGPTMDDQIFRYPAMCLAAQVLAVVALGTAREALDQLAASAGRQSVTGAPKPGARPYVQAEYAKARAILLGAKSAFYTTIEEAWDELGRSGSVSPDTRLQLRLVATKAAHDGAEAARRAFLLGGSTAIETGHPLGRCMIDAAAVAQHAFMAEGTWTAAGATVFDEPTMPGYP